MKRKISVMLATVLAGTTILGSVSTAFANSNISTGFHKDKDDINRSSYAQVHVNESTFPDGQLRTSLMQGATGSNLDNNIITKYTFKQSDGSITPFNSVKDFTGMETLPDEFWEYISVSNRDMKFNNQLPDNFNDFYENKKDDELMQDFFKNITLKVANPTSLERVIEIYNELASKGVTGFKLSIHNVSNLSMLQKLDSSVVIDRLYIYVNNGYDTSDKTFNVVDFKGLDNVRVKSINISEYKGSINETPTNLVDLEGVRLPETTSIDFDVFRYTFGTSDVSVNCPKLTTVETRKNTFYGVPTQEILNNNSMIRNIVLPCDKASVERFLQLDFSSLRKPLKVSFDFDLTYDTNLVLRELVDLIINSNKSNIVLELYNSYFGEKHYFDSSSAAGTEIDLSYMFSDVSNLTGVSSNKGTTSTVDTVKNTNKIILKNSSDVFTLTFGNTKVELTVQGYTYVNSLPSVIQYKVNGKLVATNFTNYNADTMDKFRINGADWGNEGYNHSKYALWYLDVDTVQVTINGDSNYTVNGDYWDFYGVNKDTIQVNGNGLGVINVDITVEPLKTQFNFNSNGGSSINALEVAALGDMGVEPTPTKSGFKFAGWYTDSALTNRFYWTEKNNYPFQKNKKNTMTLYAKWIARSATDKPSYASSSIGGLLPNRQIKILLDYNLNNSLSSVDKNNFTVTADGVEVGIVDIAGNQNDSSVIVLIDQDLAMGQDIRISYNGDKIEHFTNKQVNNNLTNAPSVSKPIITGAVVENDSKDRIDLTLNSTVTGDVTNVSDWKVKVNDIEVGISQVVNSNNSIQVYLQNEIIKGDKVQISYLGNVLGNVTDKLVSNKVMDDNAGGGNGSGINTPIFTGSSTPNPNTISIDLDKQVQGEIVNDKDNFTLKINGQNVVIDTITLTASNKLDLSIPQSIVEGDKITLSYAGTYITTFTDIVITNSIISEAKVLNATVSKTDKNIINLTLDKEPINVISLGDLSDFVLNKNGTILTSVDVANITTNGNTVSIELTSEIVTGDNIILSYTGTKLQQFTDKNVVNNILSIILNGSISNDSKNKITLKLDSNLTEDITTVSDFQVYVNGVESTITSITGSSGNNTIDIILDMELSHGDIVEVSYIGNQLEKATNLSIKNNIVAEKPKVTLIDSFVQGGYVTNKLILLFNNLLDDTLAYNNIVTVFVDGTDNAITKADVVGNQLTLTLTDNVNGKNNIEVILKPEGNILEVTNYVVQNRLHNTGSLNVDINGNLIIKHNVTLAPSDIVKPPIIDGDNTIIQGGGIVGSTDIKDDITIDNSGNINLPDGSVVDGDGNIIKSDGTVVKPNGDATVGGGTITLPNGGILIKPNGTVENLTNGSVIAPSEEIKLPNGGTTNDGLILDKNDTVISNGKPIVDENGNITLPNGGIVTKPSGLTTALKPGTVIKPIVSDIGSSGNIGGNSSGSAIINGTIGNLAGSNTTTENNKINNDSLSVWYGDILEKLKQKGIISDKDLGNLQGNITRGEFAYYIVRLLDKEYGINLGVSSNKFNDIDLSVVTHSALLQLNSEGIFLGYGNGTMKPNNNITREEMAVVVSKLANYLGIKDKKAVKDFEDIGIAAEWSKLYIRELQSLTILEGTGSNLFDPKKNLSKVEGLSLIYKMLKENR